MLRAGATCLLLIFGGCGASVSGDRTVDNLALQRSLQRRLAAETQTIVDRVACPGDVRARAGVHLECNASFNGEADAIEVTLTDATGLNGRYRARLHNLLLGKLETVVKRAFASQPVRVAVLDCPEPQPQRRGHSFTCNVEDQHGRRAHLRVVELDDSGRARFTLVK
jgi:hypothetical protein